MTKFTKAFLNKASLLSILFYFGMNSSFGQVGIGAPDPNGSSALEIRDNAKGLLIPRLSNAQRDGNLADNDPSTVPPSGVVNSAIEPGLLIFNTSINSFQFWDGTLWQTLYFNPFSTAGNEGVVQIVGQNGSAANKPSLSLSKGSGTAYGAYQYVTYSGTVVLSSTPLTSWPANVINPTVADVYQDSASIGRFLENAIPGQFHIWRVIANYTISNNSSAFVEGRLDNPRTGFSTTFIQPVGSIGSGNSATLTFLFYTIADQGSITTPVGTGLGYRLGFRANTDAISSFTIQSVTRWSGGKQ